MEDKKWSDLLKFIVEEVGKEPFCMEFNISSFASLSDPALLGIFHTVLCEIDPNKYAEDCKNDSSFVKGQLHVPCVMELLRVLRYWNLNKGNSEDPEVTNKALLIPVQETIWEIMGWILSKQSALKERAYLAQFMVKVQIPDEMLLDEGMATCFEQYEKQIELFKETHKQLKEIKRKMERRPVPELVSDLGRIDHDYECLSRKVDSVKIKMGKAFPFKEENLLQAKLLRKEREAKTAMQRQYEEEQNKLADLMRKEELLSLQMNDLMDLNDEGNPETSLNRLEQDSEILKHIVQEKLPRQIDIAKRKYLAFRITEENPPLCSADLEFRKQRMEEVSQEIQFLLESGAIHVGTTPMITNAKDQLAKCHQKKLDLVKNLRLIEMDHTTVLKEFEERRSKYETTHCNCTGDTNYRALHPSEYKEYVHSMRRNATHYKEKRAELQSLQTELGNLSVTKYILEGESKFSANELHTVEEKLGIVGLPELQPELAVISKEKSALDIKKMEGIHNMTSMVKKLNSELWQSKTRWQEILKEVTEKRKELISIRDVLGKVHVQLEENVGPIREQIVELEKNMIVTQDNLANDRLVLVQIASELPIMKTELSRTTVSNDYCNYSSQHSSRKRVDPVSKKEDIALRGQILETDRVRSKLLESARIQQQLKHQVSQLEETAKYEKHQKEMWSDLAKLFKMKTTLLKEQRQNDGLSGRAITTDDATYYWKVGSTG